MKISHPLQLLFLVCLMLSGFWYIISASTGLLLIAAAVAGCNAIFTRQTFQFYSLTKLMLAYLTWLLVVTFTSTVPNASMMMLSILAGLPIMYLVASNMPNFTQLWQHLRMIIFVIGVGFALLAIWQVATKVSYGLANGPLTDRNAFAAQSNLIWFPAVFLFVSMQSTSKRWLTILLGLGLFVISVALFATTSRGGILTWALLLPFMLWAVYKQTNLKKQVLTVLAIAVLAYASSAYFLHSNIANRTFQVGPSTQAGELSKDPSTSARLMMWQSTIRMAQAHPVIGTGWDTFKAYYPAYRSPSEYSTTGRYAHNDYLQFAAEGGTVAMLLLLGIALKVLLQLRQCLKHVADKNHLEATALLLGVLAIFIQASVNFIFCFSFMNIVAGLYLAYSAKLIETLQTTQLPVFIKIKPPIKHLLAGVLILFLSLPYLMNLVAQTCLIEPQFGMKIINLINPTLTPYKLARFITAIRPQEAVAQVTILNAETNAFLQSDTNSFGNLDRQRNLLNDTLNRFDYVREKNAFNPDLGVQQVRLLLQHHALIDAQFSNGTAFAKAHQILADNFKMNPLDTDSIIMLARLQAAEGKSDIALSTLKSFFDKVTFHIDQQLIYLEMLRLRAAPITLIELDEIELQLHQITNSIKMFKESKLPSINFYNEVDTKLGEINTQIKQAKLIK